jgi:hypothetical protein
VLAQAILNDYLGFKTDLEVSKAFMRDVISLLPSSSNSQMTRSTIG